MKILWIFYRKLLIPAVGFSLLLSYLVKQNLGNFGISFLFMLPLLQYFIYEIRLKNEYVFYANFGFSRKMLWIITLTFSIFVYLIFRFL